MNVTEVINALERYKSSNKLMACIGQDTDKLMFIGVFGNAYGRPFLSVRNEIPQQGAKTCSTLLFELKLWKEESDFYDCATDIYMSALFEYEDESYDFRYFKLHWVKPTKECLLLIGDLSEDAEMREHFDAFDENQYDVEDDE